LLTRLLQHRSMSTSDPDSVREDLEATLQSRTRRRALSTSAFQRLKAALLQDSYTFTRQVCKHRDLIPRIHAPISYMASGSTARLIETLDMPSMESYVTRKLRDELRRRLHTFGGEYPWRSAAGYMAIDAMLNGSMIRPAVLNFRMSRRFFKSSVITHGTTLFITTNDPDETVKITHAVDPKAWEFCEQIGKTVLSGTYRDLFPERIPEGDLTRLITQKRITLGGRTISHPQTTIQASGCETKEEAAHYSTFVNDDLVTEQTAKEPESLRYVRKWLKSLTGFYMVTRPVRRLEVGVKHDEDDDDTYLTSGEMAEQCLTLRVPIEEHKRKIFIITERGTPTCPELFPSEKISAEQASVLSGDEDEDGYRVWWNHYLLSATGGSLRLFPPELVDDPERWWMGPFQHDKSEYRKKNRYLIAKYTRDREGKVLAKAGHERELYQRVDGELVLAPEWHKHADITMYDPWLELDRVLTIDPAWSEASDSTKPDNWSVNAVGQDWDDVRLQLESLSDVTGIEGWVSALDYMWDRWQPRVWAIDSTAAQAPFIENLIRTDKRLRRIASRMIKVHHTRASKGMRMQEGLSQPLLAYRFLLAPPYRAQDGAGSGDSLGGNMTRDELRKIKSTAKVQVRTDIDGIADGLSMAGAVLRSARKRALNAEQSSARRHRARDPYTGITTHIAS
jgi:hypothetical protein